MRVLASQVIPIFFRREPGGTVAAQIKYFDVFYLSSPVVGFHVIGSPVEDCPISGFVVDAPGEPEEGIAFSVEASISETPVVWFQPESETPAHENLDFIVESDDGVEDVIARFLVEDEE